MDPWFPRPFPQPLFQWSASCFASSLAFCPSSSWVARSSSRRRERSIMHRLVSTRKMIVFWSEALPGLGVPGISRSTGQLPAASFKGRVGCTNLFSLKNGNAQRATEKAEPSLWTWDEAVGCGALCRGLAVDHVGTWAACGSLQSGPGLNCTERPLSVSSLRGPSPRVRPALKAFYTLVLLPRVKAKK